MFGGSSHENHRLDEQQDPETTGTIVRRGGSPIANRLRAHRGQMR